MNKLLLLISGAVISGSAFASAPSALSLPGYFGNLNNNTGYVLECSQVIGGYCANNPMPANGYIQMLPDPGSTQIQGHVMVFDKNVPGKYMDNVRFIYSEQKSGLWKFQLTSLYNKVSIKMITPDTVLLNKAGS